MTVTTSITGQSIGTSTNVGTGLFAQKVTKQAATTAIVIAVRVTNGAAAYDRHAEVRVWFTSSPFSITAAEAVVALRADAKYVDIRPNSAASGVAIRNSELETILGTYIYFWCDVPAVTTAQTLDVSLVEVP